MAQVATKLAACHLLLVFALCLLVLTLSGCVSLPRPLPANASSPVLDPLLFFAGRTEGRGELRKILSSPIQITVRSHGIVDEEGILTLEQEVLEGEKPPRKRSWRIHRVDSKLYRCSLSDAKGPVTISVDGNRMHIAFTMEGGFAVDQYIFLAADRQSARNILVVSKLGMRVAVLEEDIVKIFE
jgi:hypothetical protein